MCQATSVIYEAGLKNTKAIFPSHCQVIVYYKLIVNESKQNQLPI